MWGTLTCIKAAVAQLLFIETYWNFMQHAPVWTCGLSRLSNKIIDTYRSRKYPLCEGNFLRYEVQEKKVYSHRRNGTFKKLINCQGVWRQTLCKMIFLKSLSVVHIRFTEITHSDVIDSFSFLIQASCFGCHLPFPWPTSCCLESHPTLDHIEDALPIFLSFFFKQVVFRIAFSIWVLIACHLILPARA